MGFETIHEMQPKFVGSVQKGGVNFAQPPSLVLIKSMDDIPSYLIIRLLDYLVQFNSLD